MNPSIGKTIHPLIGMALAQLAIPLLMLALNVSGEGLTTYLEPLVISLPLSVIIGWPLLLILIKTNSSNLFSVIFVSLVVPLPVFTIFGFGYIGTLLFPTAFLGGILCWAYLRYVRLTSTSRVKLFVSFAFVFPAIIGIVYLVHGESPNKSYDSSLSQHIESYKSLDRSMTKSITQERQKLNDQNEP